jgi:hypothetical protein
MLSLAPEASTAADETHSALVVGPEYNGAFAYACGVTTAQQLRQGTDPNDWEVAWLVWNYTDNDHFYYFIAKAVGWELGKRVPVSTAAPGGQVFLKTGSDPVFPIGARADIEISQTGGTMKVTVNGSLVVSCTDEDGPYTKGKIGFYVEDAVDPYERIHGHGS